MDGNPSSERPPLERVLAIAQAMSEEGILLDRMCLTALVNACVDTGSLPHAMHFLRCMRKLGQCPRPATYLLIINAMLKQVGEDEGGLGKYSGSIQRRTERR
jgi:hypothetical protein